MEFIPFNNQVIVKKVSNAAEVFGTFLLKKVLIFSVNQSKHNYLLDALELRNWFYNKYSFKNVLAEN